jgi:nitroreductase
MWKLARRGLKAAADLAPGLRAARMRWRAKTLRLRCYFYDYEIDRKHVGWKRGGNDYWRLSSELIFQHHKLEKGLCLPPDVRRFFGVEAANETFRLMKKWRAAGLDTQSPIYRGALDVLAAWRRRMDLSPPDEPLRSQLAGELDALGLTSEEAECRDRTPIALRAVPDHAFETLEALARARRSVRDFDGRPVDLTLIERAASIAQLSPSACNRQPWRLHLYDDRAAIDRLLVYQNGNRGFGHTIPLLAIVTCEHGAFFDSSERNEPALDGGLFLMSFILALQALGLSSCCLNWCVEPVVDVWGHAAAGIPHSEKILTFLAIGRAREGAVTPLSARRPLEDVISLHRSR